MHRIFPILILTLLFVAPAMGKEIQVDGGKITFDAPDGFEPVPKEILDLKYPSSRAPKYVIGNKTAGTTIAYDIKPNALPQEGIEEGRKAFTELFPRMIPGLEWIENKTIELAGQKWIYLEMTSNALDTDIHNIMLFTGHDGQMLAFNFNSTKEEFKEYEKAIRASIKSIKFNKADAPAKEKEPAAKP